MMNLMSPLAKCHELAASIAKHFDREKYDELSSIAHENNIDVCFDDEDGIMVEDEFYRFTDETFA